MISKWDITPIYPIYKWVITHLLTVDPNLLGHPSREGITPQILLFSDGIGTRKILFDPGGVWILTKFDEFQPPAIAPEI